MQTLPAGPYTSFFTITKSDTTLVNCRAIYVGGTGDVAVKSGTPGAAAVTFSAVPVGTVLQIALDRGFVMSTNTTATLLLALA